MKIGIVPMQKGEPMSKDTIYRQDAIDALDSIGSLDTDADREYARGIFNALPSAQSEIVRCKDCKWWRQQTNYQGAPLSFGFCESDDMWRSLYGETYEVSHIDTEDDFYCGYARRR